MTDATPPDVDDEWKRAIRRAVLPVVVLLLLLVTVVASAGGVAIVALFTQASSIKQDAKDSQTRDLGALVAVCAIPEVNKVQINNFVSRLEAAGIDAAHPAKLQEAFDKAHEELGPFDCKALVPAKDRVQVCLQYPTTIPKDPKATTTTEFQPACERQ